MRKAASHILQSGVIAGVVGIILALVFVVSASAYSVDSSKSVSGDGKPDDGVSGNISISGTHATGTVTNSSNESVDVGIASYKKVTQDGISDQIYFSSEVFSVKAGETKSVAIEIPCWSQVDLFRVFGSEFSVIHDFGNGDRYAERMLSAVHTSNECSEVTASPTPTATASASPSATPVASVEPTPNPTPVVGGGSPRNDLSDGRSDGRGCSVNDCSGNVVPVGGAVLGSSTQTLPSTGSLDVTLYAIVGMIFGLGIMMRIKADRDEASFK